MHVIHHYPRLSGTSRAVLCHSESYVWYTDLCHTCLRPEGIEWQTNFCLTEKSTMDEIIELENQRIAAMIAGDEATLDAVLADDLIYTHSTARVETKAEFIGNVTSGRTRYVSLERDDVNIRDYGDTAVVTGHAKLHVMANDRDLKFQVRFLDVYCRLNGSWQMVAWQSTKIPD